MTAAWSPFLISDSSAIFWSVLCKIFLHGGVSDFYSWLNKSSTFLTGIPQRSCALHAPYPKRYDALSLFFFVLHTSFVGRIWDKAYINLNGFPTDVSIHWWFLPVVIIIVCLSRGDFLFLQFFIHNLNSTWRNIWCFPSILLFYFLGLSQMTLRRHPWFSTSHTGPEDIV